MVPHEEPDIMRESGESIGHNSGAIVGTVKSNYRIVSYSKTMFLTILMSVTDTTVWMMR